MNLSDEEFLSLSGQMSDRDVMKICGYTKKCQCLKENQRMGSRECR